MLIGEKKKQSNNNDKTNTLSSIYEKEGRNLSGCLISSVRIARGGEEKSILRKYIKTELNISMALLWVTALLQNANRRKKMHSAFF